ncbi:hypothetical protein J6590_093645 [Homalodisca vitripennis]|nr:hypothetical protein J6590_093645 [Homalodisca vitripennis]
MSTSVFCFIQLTTITTTYLFTHFVTSTLHWRSAPWITDVRNLQAQRDSAFRKVKRTKSPADWLIYKRLRNRAKQQFRNAKIRFYYLQCFVQQSTKLLWKKVKEFGTGKVNSKKPISIDLNIINYYFVDIPIDLSGARDYTNELSTNPAKKNCEAHLTTATSKESDKPCPKNCEKHLTPVTVRESDKPCLQNCYTLLNTDHTNRTHSSHCYLTHQQSRNRPMSSPEQGPNIIKVQPEIHRYIDGTEPELPKNQGLPALKLKRKINPPAKDLDVMDSLCNPKVNTPSNTNSACTIKNPTCAKTTHGTSPAKNCHKEKTNLEASATQKTEDKKQNLHKQKQVEENITLLHQNIRKLENKRERLNHILSEVSPTILVLTEHGLPQANLNNTTIPGYRQLTSFCRSHHDYGGVVLYLKDDTEVEEIPISIKKPGQEMVFETAMSLIKTETDIILLLGFIGHQM